MGVLVCAVWEWDLGLSRCGGTSTIRSISLRANSLQRGRRPFGIPMRIWGHHWPRTRRRPCSTRRCGCFALPIDPAWAYRIYVLGHVILALATSYSLARRWEASPMAATAGGDLVRLLRQRALPGVQCRVSGGRCMDAVGLAGGRSDAAGAETPRHNCVWGRDGGHDIGWRSPGGVPRRAVGGALRTDPLATRSSRAGREEITTNTVRLASNPVGDSGRRCFLPCGRAGPAIDAVHPNQ